MKIFGASISGLRGQDVFRKAYAETVARRNTRRQGGAGDRTPFLAPRSSFGPEAGWSPPRLGGSGEQGCRVRIAAQSLRLAAGREDAVDQAPIARAFRSP